jgi:aminoglycoside phosphotransferase (APT) family kinase protein
MPKHSDAEVRDIIEAINCAHAASLTLEARAASGESGAYVVRDAAGSRLILKFGHGREFEPTRAARMTGALRALGYPAPEYLIVGEIGGARYAVQRILAGELLLHSSFSRARLDAIIALNRIQRGRSSEPGADWLPELRRSVFEGFEEYCRVDTLKNHSPETRRMLEHFQRIAAAAEDAPCPVSDVVHWDFHGGNILVEGDRISGVIDWDGLRFGDASFDLMTLLFYSYRDEDTRRPLWDEARAHSSMSLLRLYLAHVIVRQLDWSIRNHSRHVSDFFTGFAHELMRMYLADDD